MKLIRDKILFYKNLIKSFNLNSDALNIFNSEISNNLYGFGILLTYLNENNFDKIDAFLDSKLNNTTCNSENINHHNKLIFFKENYFCNECNQMVYKVETIVEAEKRIALKQPIIVDKKMNIKSDLNICILNENDIHKKRSLEEIADENESLEL